MIELLRESWDWFLFDTLLWTGALIAFVLILRRPVARYFGSGAAYALWFLPLARMAFPPVILPAWMRATNPVERSALVETTPTMTSAADTATALPVVATVSPQLASGFDVATPLAIVWLLGAAIFLGRRFWLYGSLRKQLLAKARPVGEAGSIRLVETPAISGPMAFGVFDKVVALPEGFIASRNRQARDLAIEHELAHHRGHDLLVNILVQPLFAAHWFNPLGWIGWTALRRDQEAACDARVVAARPREERAAYANIIADFARRPNVAPRLALAAPMACPVLGDKSIIHRLRSLSMSDISSRRRWAGRTGIAAAMFALPLTASVCYSQASAAPEPPAFPTAPEAPSAPGPVVPDAPPAPPLPPEVPATDHARAMAHAENALERGEEEMERAEHAFEKTEHRKVTRNRVVRLNGENWNALSPEERDELKAELRELRAEISEDGELHRELEELRRELGENGEMRREIEVAVAEAVGARAVALASAPRVVMKCKDKTNYIRTEQDAHGRMTMFVCEANAEKLALNALRSARTAIGSERNLTGSQRAEALRSIDEEIASLKN